MTRKFLEYVAMPALAIALAGCAGESDNGSENSLALAPGAAGALGGGARVPADLLTDSALGRTYSALGLAFRSAISLAWFSVST